MAPLILMLPLGPLPSTPGASSTAALRVRFTGSLFIKSALKLVATCEPWPMSPVGVPVTVTVSLTVETFNEGLTVTVWPGDTRCVCLRVLNPVSVNVTV